MTGAPEMVSDPTVPTRRRAGEEAPICDDLVLESLARADIRLIATDLDGTLLTPEGSVPPGFWPLLASARQAGMLFAPASGRQHQTMRELFGDDDATVFIAENGSNVVHRDTAVFHGVIDVATAETVVQWARHAADAGVDIGVVACGVRGAYIERHDTAFRQVVQQYYRALAPVEDVLIACRADELVKIALYDFGYAARDILPALGGLDLQANVVLSGAHWVDVMPTGVDKGVAIREIQRRHGITASQTVAFGDFLNDAEMLDAADWSFAVANAHPDIRARARYIAPSNADTGVIGVLQHLLARGGV